MINEKLARRYCKEELSKIENYDKAIADTSQTWDLHHRTEIWWNCTAKELIENECYYNRKACEFIFLTPAEHRRLHNQGKLLSAETRIKISEAHKGKRLSEEHCRKISEAHKGKKRLPFSEEHRRKISEAKKGKKHSADTRMKISKSIKGMTWKLINGKRVYFPKEVK